MAGPMMPSLAPRVIDPLWFTVDKPCDDAELQSKLESEYHQWLHNVGSKDAHLIPIGKTLEIEKYQDSVLICLNEVCTSLDSDCICTWSCMQDRKERKSRKSTRIA
ncbi:hypothetical protein C0Q70_05447 [Pomacea canaliculata]|uniref:Uncharacterized protein n=1 Tax=Pomacea canaliculata TaxID=400727 RepID=A0A2T7PLA9_POMCA|nr:hypothetical protein C0Q70_05447 [Pomacea canaliculata]